MISLARGLSTLTCYDAPDAFSGIANLIAERRVAISPLVGPLFLRALTLSVPWLTDKKTRKDKRTQNLDHKRVDQHPHRQRDTTDQRICTVPQQSHTKRTDPSE